MRNRYPLAFIARPTIFAIFSEGCLSLAGWVFFSAAVIVLVVTFFSHCWIEVQDLPEPFSY